DDDLLDELETRLLTADVGVEATTTIVQNLTKRVARKELADSDGSLGRGLRLRLGDYDRRHGRGLYRRGDRSRRRFDGLYGL
ncbi:signal recognition particle receptor subunit alpha, partial [Pseudomonas sp. 30_B]|uniref:signal recognition particle receptor subunit alpha n=1 Tax=Pseudomonas sp. 30_B TaxID=2813575 RepID=UPI001A9F86AA